MRTKVWLIAGVLAFGSGVSGAQMTMDAPAGTLGKPMDPAKAEDIMLSNFESELTDVAKAMPAEKYSFAPSVAAFAPSQEAKFAGVRTFAQQLTHLIEANYYFYGQISGAKPEVDMKALGSMTTKDQIVPALAASFAFAHRAVATITPANAFLTIKGADGMNTRATLASFGVAHGFDHYGQLIEYLRMNGVVPPGSK